MRKSVLLAALVLFSISYAHAQIPPVERTALIALYNSTDGSNWSNNSNWLGAVDTECTWYGVSCGVGHVIQLQLPSNRLSGVIPAELGNLSSLWNLKLNSNQLSGSIPTELGDLSNLQYLILYANSLSGSIPTELGNLAKLRQLQLYNNSGMSGGIPTELGNLSSLQWLTLYNNQLGGSIPPELGNLSSLQYLFLSGNQLSGNIPPELGNLSSLRSLDLTNNQLNGSIPLELGNLSSLLSLELDLNELSGSIPPELGSLTSLLFLYLYSNQLSGSIPPELGNLSSLTELYLSSNQLSGSIPPELGNLSSLEGLRLFSNKLSGSIPLELGNLSSLTELYLNSNQLSGVIPAELENLSTLQRLYLYSNRLSGSIPAELENLSTLVDESGLRIRWNALHTDNATLIAFLDGKQRYGDWQSTQTIAPVNLTFDRVGDHTVWLSWDAVSYQIDPGGYSVFSAPTGTGVWTAGGWTESKTDTTFPVTGLDPATPYDFAIISYTDPHLNNLNLVHSDFSPEVVETTASGGCAQPDIEKVDPTTLSVLGSYNSYLWNAGEITSSIAIDPLLDQWYWARVASTGPCDETATIWVGPAIPVFADGFESGDTSAWSLKMP